MRKVMIGLLLAGMALPAVAQEKSDGRSQGARRQLKEVPIRPVPPNPPPPAVSSRIYVDSAPEYRHIQIRRRVDSGPRTKLDVRELTRVMRSPSLEVYRFEPPRITQVETVIRLFDSGDHERALRTWGGFVASLRDRTDPIDLDDLMLYIARESCFGRNPAARFHAQRLAHLRQAQDDTRFYLAQCQANLRDASRDPHAGDVRRELEIEINRTTADLQILEIREQQAMQRYDMIRARGDRYERDFIVLYDQLYNEACTRIQLRAGRGYRRP